MRRRSAPWSHVESRRPKRLRVSLLEVVFQRMDQIAREKEAARARQDALMAELDKRISSGRLRPAN